MKIGRLSVVCAAALSLGMILPSVAGTSALAHRASSSHVGKKPTCPSGKVAKKVKKGKKTKWVCKATKAEPTPVPTNKPVVTQVFGTLRLNGTMTSIVHMSMTGAFSLGKMTDFTWDLPMPGSPDKEGLVQTNGYSLQVLDGNDQPTNAPSFAFSADGVSASAAQPDSYKDITDEGHLVREFHWTNPPEKTTLRVTEFFNAKITSNMDPFKSTATLPLQNVPADVQTYLGSDPAETIDSSADSLVQGFIAKSNSEQDAVTATADWVAQNTKYSLDHVNGPFDAEWVFQNHLATCRGFDDELAGLLRREGIPTQVQFGWVNAKDLTFPGPDGQKATLGWSDPGSSGEPHTWLNVWFPDQGWVPFDPQAEKFFVDPRHIAFFTGMDASDSSLDWYGTWNGFSKSGDSPTGPSLSATTPNLYEAVPGDGVVSKTTFVDGTPNDNFQLTFRDIVSDVNNMVLYSR